MKRNLLAALLVGLALAPVGASAQSYDGENRWVRIVNDSWHSVVAIYAVPSRFNSGHVGGRDWIPETVIRSRGRYSVNFNDRRGTCHFDIRAAGSNGRDWITRNFNVCRRGSWRLAN